MMLFTQIRRNFKTVLLGLIGLLVIGCSRKENEDLSIGSLNAHLLSSDISTGNFDFTGLNGVLTGKWKTGDHTLEFTSGKTVFLNRLGFEKVAKFEFGEGNLRITAEADGMRRSSSLLKPASVGAAANEYTYAVEFLSDSEVSLRLEQSGEGFDWFQLAGRWERIGLPVDREQLQKASGPISDAKRQVQRIEQKILKLESVLRSTHADRDELAIKLRSVGINSPADLKNNVRGQRLAEYAVRLATEIESLELQLADIDGELLKAKSITRQMEREQATLSDEEMKSLALQLRFSEERMDGTQLPITPLDVDAAVEKALKGSPERTPKNSK